MNYEEQQFEQEMTAEDRHIDALLAEALVTQTPEGLADRVAHASREYLLESSAKTLEQRLDMAFSVDVPAGLASRVFDASVSQLHNVHPVVIARIGRSVAWRQLALAACVLFAVLVAIRFGSQPLDQYSQQPLVAINAVLSVEDEELLLEDLNLSEFAYLADSRELAFVDVAESLNGLRNDIELWQYGLLSE
ncbi:MAG: hypothetical protein ISR75_00680 [Phycisphaerales bacterium]|nr:hypothetical protein [Planctomycetota bacterium]MBL6996937.1 hypothetical protein [Phycisphaerales bacterium]